jgi:hypothetical protein
MCEMLFVCQKLWKILLADILGFYATDVFKKKTKLA